MVDKWLENSWDTLLKEVGSYILNLSFKPDHALGMVNNEVTKVRSFFF
jgi:hypothetical protein